MLIVVLAFILLGGLELILHNYLSSTRSSRQSEQRLALEMLDRQRAEGKTLRQDIAELKTLASKSRRRTSQKDLMPQPGPDDEQK